MRLTMCLFACVLLVALGGVARAEAGRFGIVEIGGSGVKASVVEIVASAEELSLVSVRDYAARNVNAAFAEQAPAVALAVAELVGDMRSRYGLSPLRIYVVGSSGLESLDHAGALRAGVDRAVAGQAGAMVFVSAPEQAQLGFEGIVNCARLAHRRGDALYVDIGSSDITGAAATEAGASACGDETIATVSTGAGVKTIARAPADERGAQIEAAAARVAGAAPTRSRVYLGGGIVWALTTFAHPGEQSRFTPLSAADIAAFRAQIESDPLCITDPEMAQRADAGCVHLDVDMSSVADPGQRARASADHREIVTSVYTLDQLRTGAALLAALAERLELANKRVFFARASERAWVLGFLLQQEAGAQ